MTDMYDEGPFHPEPRGGLEILTRWATVAVAVIALVVLVGGWLFGRYFHWW